MSLINDALKRAKKAQERNAPPPVPQLRPVEPARTAKRGPGTGWWLVGAAVVFVAGGILALVALSGGAQSHRHAQRITAVNHLAAPYPKPATAPPAQINPVTNTAAVANAAPVAATVAPSQAAMTSANGAVAGGAASASNAPAAPATPALPKLQGIFYRPDHPSAVLNGKNVFVGSQVGEFLVVAIAQQSVTVVRGGETNVLSLTE